MFTSFNTFSFTLAAPWKTLFFFSLLPLFQDPTEPPTHSRLQWSKASVKITDRVQRSSPSARYRSADVHAAPDDVTASKAEEATCLQQRWRRL